MGHAQVSELKDEEVPEDPHGLLEPPSRYGPRPGEWAKDEGVPEDPHEDPQDMGLTQVSELKDEGVPEDPHGLLQPPSRYGPHPGEWAKRWGSP